MRHALLQSQQLPLFEGLDGLLSTEQPIDPLADKRRALRRARRLAESANRNPARGVELIKTVLGDMRQLTIFDSPDNDENFVWDEEAIWAIHEMMLVDALTTLRDSRLSAERFDQIVQWIAEPLYTLGSQHQPAPFTFAACCMVVGIDGEGVERLQDTLLNSVIPQHCM